MARKRSSMSGAYSVGGDERTFPTLGMAINVASRKAELATEEMSVGIYRGDEKAARVVRHADGAVSIRALTKEES